MTTPLHEIADIASNRAAGLETLLDRRARVLGAGELMAVRDALALFVEHHQIGMERFVQDNGYPPVVATLREELTRPGMHLVLLELPEGETDD